MGIGLGVAVDAGVELGLGVGLPWGSNCKQVMEYGAKLALKLDPAPVKMVWAGGPSGVTWYGKAKVSQAYWAGLRVYWGALGAGLNPLTEMLAV